IEIEPVRWDEATLSTNVRWGLPALARWYSVATEFEGVPLTEPVEKPNPETLESYIRKREEAAQG
ncbi:hypothetical protein, partial [Novosphingobium sp.]|uniref:hypothetical protein n=1 Tax=Novosphingobium sp. TaxID=1874826 RepID=UPI002B4AAA8B